MAYLTSNKVKKTIKSILARTFNFRHFSDIPHQTIMRLFVRAERTGDWELHLHSVKAMLPYLHAAGHLSYAKSAQLYVQQMDDLPHKMSEDDYNTFTKEGYITIRFGVVILFWCGNWSDMTIEQVIMRSMKTSGVLTRGRGITESTLARWVLAIPLYAPMCNDLFGDICRSK